MRRLIQKVVAELDADADCVTFSKDGNILTHPDGYAVRVFERWSEQFHAYVVLEERSQFSDTLWGFFPLTRACRRWRKRRRRIAALNFLMKSEYLRGQAESGKNSHSPLTLELGGKTLKVTADELPVITDVYKAIYQDGPIGLIGIHAKFDYSVTGVTEALHKLKALGLIEGSISHEYTVVLEEKPQDDDGELPGGRLRIGGTFVYPPTQRIAACLDHVYAEIGNRPADLYQLVKSWQGPSGVHWFRALDEVNEALTILLTADLVKLAGGVYTRTS